MNLQVGYQYSVNIVEHPDDRPSPKLPLHRRRRSLLWSVLIGLLAFGALVVLAHSIVQSQNQARDGALDRFGDRSAITAKLLSGTLAQVMDDASRDTALQLRGNVSPRDLQRLEGAGDPLTPYTAVYGPDGELLAVHPHDAKPSTSAASKEAVAAALDGTPSLTDVQSTAAGDILEIVIPFTTPDDERRVWVVAYPPKLVGSSLRGPIEEAAIGDQRGSAVVLDHNGEILLRVDGQRSSGRDGIEHALARALRDGRTSGSIGADRFVISPIEGTSLDIAVVRSTSDILSSLPSTAGPRIALAALGLLLLVTCGLGVRIARSNERLEAARREADLASEAKSRFLTHITHELKTPIAVIRGFAQLLMRDIDDEPTREHARHIVESGDHLAALTNELLEVARIEAGKVTLSIERVDVRDVLDEVMVLVSTLAESRRIRLEPPAVRADLPLVLADPIRLRQVLLNLLSNAIKYNRDRGTVRCDITRLNGEIRVDITDSGLGIRRADLDRLFQPFERLNAPTATITGSGLGLVVSKGLIDAMDGTMSVTSIIDEGSTFSFTLPIVGDREPDDQLPRTAPPADSGSLLYVDDNPPSLELVRSMLGSSRPGVVVRTTSTGQEALELARAVRPDVLLLDLNLGDTTGEDVLRELRTDPATASVSVLVVSADSTSRDVTRLLRTGADAYLTKPLDEQQFVHVIDRLLATALPPST